MSVNVPIVFVERVVFFLLGAVSVEVLTQTWDNIPGGWGRKYHTFDAMLPAPEWLPWGGKHYQPCLCFVRYGGQNQFTVLMSQPQLRRQGTELDLNLGPTATHWNDLPYQWTDLLTFPEVQPGMSHVFPLSGVSELPFDSPFLSPLLFFSLVLFVFSLLSFFE